MFRLYQILVICSFLTFFIGVQAGDAVQIFAISLFLIAILLSLTGSREVQDESGMIFVSFLFCIALPLQSILVGLTRGNMAVAQLSIVLLTTCCFMYVWMKNRSLLEAANLFLWAAALMLLAGILFDYREFLDSLAARGNRFGRIRFSPFNNHPNLTGYIFGMVATISYFRLRTLSWGVQRFGILALYCASVLAVLASVSRGSLLALIVATAATEAKITFDRLRTGRVRLQLGYLLLFSAVAAACILLNASYFADLLEFDSTARGVDSGFSGRSDNWVIILSETASSPLRTLFGSGYRSWDPFAEGRIGVETDSSYVNLCWEFGILPTILTFLAVLSKLIFDWRTVDEREGGMRVGIVGFALVASIFARYFYAIGNPASLILLCTLLSVPTATRRGIQPKNTRLEQS